MTARPEHTVFFFVFVSILSVSHGQAIEEQDTSWDLLIFTQQWPNTVCKDWTNHDPKHQCFLPSDPDSWTIHGVWPTKLGTIGPGFCNRTWHFDPEQIKPIENSLMQYWTDIEDGKTSYNFWAHEWTKHGTCAAVLESLNSEFKYFSLGLKWLSNFSMDDILSQANIMPDDVKQYAAPEIFNAIKKKLGVNPHIVCRKEDGKSWLLELRICFSKKLELMDCDGIRRTSTNNIMQTNCDPSQGVIYPKTLGPYIQEGRPSNHIYVQLYKFVTWLQWFTL